MGSGRGDRRRYGRGGARPFGGTGRGGVCRAAARIRRGRRPRLQSDESSVPANAPIERIMKTALAVGVGIGGYARDRGDQYPYRQRTAPCAAPYWSCTRNGIAARCSAGGRAVPLPNLHVGCRAIVRGDTLSVSIAAASIVAKVTRDRLLYEYDIEYPQYRFDRHKGYPTPAHLRALREYGACPYHRRTFAPVRDVIANPPKSPQ